MNPVRIVGLGISHVPRRQRERDASRRARAGGLPYLGGKRGR
jgi:hypothetical protein